MQRLDEDRSEDPVVEQSYGLVDETEIKGKSDLICNCVHTVSNSPSVSVVLYAPFRLRVEIKLLTSALFLHNALIFVAIYIY